MPAKPKKPRKVMFVESPKQLRDVLTACQVADWFQLSEPTIRARADAGELPGFKVGGQWRFRRDTILDWLRMQEVESGSEAVAGALGPAMEIMAHRVAEILRGDMNA